ncbi:titin-like, partial [Pollicipes pollicipes]|uniref:titin-like n=1 Tax=Pollicipes pollicipes TaxID=41117 RepID=UPI0018850AF9
TGVSDEPPAAAAVKTQDIEKSVNELEASASQLAESPERDSLLVDVTDLRHRLTDLRGHYRPQQIMDKSQKRPRRRSKKSSGESLQETRVDERGNTHRVERSTSSEIAQSLDETGAPVFVEQVRTEVRSDSKPVARQPQVKTSEERLLDAEGRPTVATTTTTTTYEDTVDAEGRPVVVRRVTERVCRQTDGQPPQVTESERSEALSPDEWSRQQLEPELPEPSVRTEVEEYEDELGRRVVITTTVTSTFERQENADNEVVILERVHRRRQKTVYLDGQVVEESELDSPPSEPPSGSAPVVEYVSEDFELPEPKTETRTEEYEDAEGRRVVVTTTITTTYEQTDDDGGNTVILEKVHRRVQRTIYVDGEVVSEQLEEPDAGPDAKDSNVMYVDENFQIPEPSETTNVQEFVDEEGRRVVVRTTIRTAYEETEDEDGSPVILEKIQKRVQRTVYVDGKIVEETIDAPDDVEENIELPPSTEREEVEEHVDDLGRRVVIRSVYTTTYEQDRDGDGNVVILEKVQKRVFRTVFVDGKEIVEEIRDPSRKKSVEYVLEIPEPKTEEHVESRVDENGRRVTIKTITRTTYEEGRDDDGTPVILEKAHTTRITYRDGEEVVEETSAENADQLTWDPARDFVLPEPRVTEEEREYIDEQGRTVVEKTTTTVTYEKKCESDGSITVLENVCRRVMHTVYVDGQVVEVIKDPTPEPDVSRRSRTDVESLVEKQPPTTGALTNTLLIPKPSVVEDVVEHTEPDGRRVVTKTIITTTYDAMMTETDDVVVYEKVHRRILRTVYDGDQLVEEVEEPTPEPTVTKKTAEEIHKLSKQNMRVDAELPEPKTEEEVQESTDDQGRRIVTKTVTTTTYEKQTDDEGAVVILEKVQRRVYRTIYIGDQVIEEVDEPVSTSAVDMREAPLKKLDIQDTMEQPKLAAVATEKVRLPEPSTTEDVVEHTEPDGRRVVTRTVTTTTYETETTDSGDLVIYEKIHRRIFRTVYLGDQVIEEVEEPTTEPTMTKKTAKDIEELVVDIQLPEPKTEEHVTESVDEQGRRVVIKTVTTTTYEKQSDDEGNIVILEKVQRRVHRTIYAGDEVIEQIDEPDSTSSTNAAEVNEAPVKVSSRPDTKEMPKTTTAEKDEIRLPEPSTTEDVVEHTEPDGRRVVTRTVTTTTYETETTDSGDLVIYEKIHRRIFRTVYLGDQVIEEVEEPTTEPTMTQKTAKDIEELIMDIQLPEPKTEEHVTESVDEQGRRVVIKTVTTTTYEEQSDDEGNIVILEKVQRRVHRTIYAGDEVIEQIDEPDSTSSTNAVEVSEAPVKVSSRPDTKEMPKTTTAKTDEIRLPEPSTAEDVVEHTEPDGRRVVTRTVTTTTYETETTDSGDLVIYEKIHRRIFRTVYLGDQVIEEVEEPTTEPTMTQKTAKDIEELIMDIQLPEPKTEEHVTESVDEQGRRVVIRTVTTTTYEKQSDDEGNIVILEKVQRRVHRTIYAGDEVIEQIDEPDSTSSTNAVEVSEAPVKVSSRPDTKEVPKTTAAEKDEIRLPEPSTTEDVVEHTEPDGRRVVTRTVTTTTYETETTDSGDLVIYEKIHRRIFRTVYLGDQVIEEVEEPTTEPTMTQKTAKDIEELIMDIQLPEPKTEEHVTESVDEQGRRVVIKTVTTTTYEKQSDDEGNIVILEKVQRRVHRTIYAGDEVIEQIDEPDSTSSTNAVEVSEAPVKVSGRPDTKEMPKTTTAKTDEIRLPEPSTVEDVVEHTEPDGRRVVTRTVTTTTYETETTDSGDLVIYEKIHRRIFRTVYLGDQVIEEVEEPTTEPTMTKKTAKDIKELVLDVQLPEPKTEEHVTESVDEQGRRVVIKTVTTTTYEKQSDDEGNIVILEKVQRRVHRTIYVGDKIVEEFEEPSKDPCTVHTSATEMSKLQKAVGDSENVVLPEPTIEETTEEFTEDDGRRVVVHTTITTTYDKVEENGHIVIVERVQKRVRKTIYVDGELVDVIEEVHGSADESSSAEDAPALIEWNDESDTTADTLPSEPATPVKVPTPLSPGDSKRDSTSHPAVSFVPPANANEEPSQKLPEEDRVIVHKLEEFIRYMPAISGKLVEEPQVDEDLYETIENGRKVTYKTITITIIEERQNKEGKPSTVKRLVKHIIKTSDVNGKPVVEERSEPEVVEELTRDASVPKDTEALALPRDLPGHDVRTPFKSPIDESVEIAEEAFEDPPSSTAESVELVVRPEQQISATKQDSKPLKSRPEKTKPPKKTKKKRDKLPTETPHPEQVDRKSAPGLLQEAACSVTPEQDQLGDAEAPVIKQAVVVSEPSFAPKAQSEDEVIADALRSAEGEVSERPTVRTEVVESVDPQGRRVVLKRMYITIVEDIIDELGVVTKRTRVIRKAVRTTVAADGTVAVDVVEEPAEETGNIPLSVEEHGHASKEPAAPYLKAEDYVASLAAEKDWYDKALIDDAETVYHTKHGRAQASKQQDNSTAPMQTTANIKPVQAEQLEDNVASKVAVPSKSQAHLPCGLPWLNTFEINEAERVHHERTVSQLAPHRPLMEAEGKTQHVDTSPDVHSVEKDTKLCSVPILHEEVSLDIYPLRDAERKFHERRVAQETKAPEMAEVHPDLGHETEEHKAPKEGSKDPPEVQHELGGHRVLEADIPTTDPSQKPAFEPSDVSLLLEAERRPVEDISNVMKKRFEQPALSVEPIPRKEPTAVAMELPPQWPEADTKAKPQQAVGVYQTLFDQMRHETTPEEKSANDLPELDDLPAEQPPEIPRDKVEQLHELPELRPAPKDEVDLNLVLGRLIEEPVTQIQGNAKKRSETDVDRDVIEWPHPDKRPETTVEEIRVDASPIEMMAHQLVTPSSESGGLPPLSELLPSARKEPSGSVASTEHGEPMTGTETTGSAVDAQTDEPREVAPHDVDVNVEIIGDTPDVKDQAPGVPEAPKKQGWFSKISNFITGDNEAPKDKDDASSMPVSAPIHSEPAVKKQEVADVSPSVEKHAKIPLSADPGPCVTEEEVTQTLEATPVMAVEKNLSGSPEETNDSDIIESALAEVTGIMVEKPKVEAYIEETTDRHGRKVIIRRVFVTVVEEVVDETGNKVTISRVIKKQKRCTKLNGQEIVEISNIPECKEEGIEQQPHDEVLEHAVQDTMLQKKPHATNDQVPSVATVTEPLTSLSDAETISTLLPASGNLMVSEPVVERDVTETVDRFGRKVTVVRVYITVWEEVISETGEKIVQKRRVSSAQKVTNLPSGPVVERIDERDLGEIEKLDPNSGTASDAKPVERPLMGQTDEQLVQLLLPKEGNFVGTPEVERFEKEVVDENGQKTKVVRIYLTIVEEIVTESGTKQLVRKRISKTQKSVDMDGNAVTEDTDDPIVIETLNVEESTAGAKPVKKEEIMSATPAVEEGDIPKLTVQEPDETTKVAVREASEPSVKTDKQHRDKPSKKHSKKQPKAPEEPLDPYSASLDPKKVEEELLQLLMTPSKEDKKRKPRKRSRRRNNDAAKSQELSNSSEESPKPPESAPASVSDGHDLIVEVNDPVYGHAVVVTHFDEVENDKESDHETYFKDSSVPVLESAAIEEKAGRVAKEKAPKEEAGEAEG